MEYHSWIYTKEQQVRTIPFWLFELRRYNTVPRQYNRKQLSDHLLQKLKAKHPGIELLSHDRLQCTLQILHKFDITTEDICSYINNVHVFTMNPITMDNYGEILKECGFITIHPGHIIKYHTLVRNRTIARIKKEGLVREDSNLEELIFSHFKDWPSCHKRLEYFPDLTTCILTIRMSVLQKYLTWRLSVTPEDFNKYCRNYLPLKHKPMSDIQESLDIALNDIKFDVSSIKRNGFIISSDPVNTKLIVENVHTVAGYDIREAIKIEPAILKNNYNALLQIRDILEEYRIPLEAQRRCLKVYCMRPDTVKDRLDELRNLKEYQILKTNPRVLSMVVHKRKMMNRLEKMQAAKKQCYSLNHLVSSSKVFNNYISNFGNKVCGRDLAILITSSLVVNKNLAEHELVKQVHAHLKRHKFWLHCALNVIDENIQYLKNSFNDDVILDNCLLLLYPLAEVEQYINIFQQKRAGRETGNSDTKLDSNYNNLVLAQLSDSQILSLVLYEIEKKYHFSGDGIWARQDGVRVDSINV
ncbi:transcription termination factor 5, mitochondrial-like [Hyposmocoma kahamanoa]|uniref:transcription termination factor 5, mitochondrial-like n=1 Tax=Hyposmocoma kahamanoa TaxID=1477025 RepID=UPI000E6D7453|nr:transcription termination factor 5, mitochondrial-like [Hyposmocoma kahamanoa]